MSKRNRQHRATRAPQFRPSRVQLYPGYGCIHATFDVSQYGEQEIWDDSPGPPSTPYLLLESTPCEDSNADAMEFVIPYDQLEDVIRVLMEARTLQPPEAAWHKTADGWEPLIEVPS